MNIKPGMIVSKRGPFTKDLGASRHPLVVIEVVGSLILAAVCTSYSHISRYPESVVLDYRQCNLKKPTIVICNKLIRFQRSELRSIIRELSRSQFNDILLNVVKHAAASDIRESIYNGG